MFKPITLSILLIILGIFSDLQPHVLWVAVALSLAVCVDLLAAFQKIGKRAAFVMTLIMFICYSKSFWLQLEGGLSWWLPALLFASAVIVFFLMLPRLDSIVFPVLMMGLVLVQLCWAATQLCLSAPAFGHQLACAGAYLFALSALLGAGNTKQSNKANKNSLVLGSYLLAHSLIVASVL